MGRRRKFGRPVSGVIIIDKPQGITSNDVVQKVKRLFFAEKAGHTGALDPLATGVLPICLGEATKFSQYLLDSDKAYRSEFVLGETTDTADADGEVKQSIDASQVNQDQLETLIAGKYSGWIKQVPPMYSALKKDGQPLYKLARKGVEVEREARDVCIHKYELLEFNRGEKARATVNVHCSKGTYIRSLAEDLGRDLGVGGHVATLHRSQAGDFQESQMHSLESLAELRGEGRAETLDQLLLPMDILVQALPPITLDSNESFYFTRGQAVMVNQLYRLGDEGDKVRVYENDDKFLGVAEIGDDSKVNPKRLVVYPETSDNS